MSARAKPVKTSVPSRAVPMQEAPWYSTPPRFSTGRYLPSD